MSQATASPSSTLPEPALNEAPQGRSIHDVAGQGELSGRLIAILLGGTLLMCSFIAQRIWENGFYTALPAVLAVILLGGPLILDAAKDVLKGKFGMNVLVALAVIGAFSIHKYQEAAAVAFFMVISALIENRTAIGAQASIESLIKITPTKAQKLVNGEEVTTEAKDLQPGDIVRVRPGDNIPADGEVIAGQSTVNQASITGESVPVDKSIADEAFGGTINMTGVLDIKVTKAGGDTTLGRVKELILEAEKTRTPIMRMIDQYAGWYTPTILMLVAIVLFFNLRKFPDTAFDRAIAMLVVAVPSALILATPTAMVAALSAAARLGVLIKSVVTLEAARNLTAMVFDKTGTLTTGVLTVSRLAPTEGTQGVDLLRVAASAEQNSKHPVARAVADMGRKAKLQMSEPEEFKEIAGRGVIAKIDGSTVHVGRATWITDPDTGLTLSDEDKAVVDETTQDGSEAEGLSVLYVAKDGKLLGWIGMEDNARAEAPAAMDRLRDQGLNRLVILTGDRTSVAKRVATQMHIPEFKAEVLPHEKLEMVDELKEKGHRVAVIGDGVNDAPALAAGDISIAMGAAGSDVAIHSASIALMNSNLNRIPFLIDLSRRTIGVIRLNMIIGAFFITIFMTLAGAGYVSPILAAMLHVVSGMAVIFNSARLVRAGERVEMEEAEYYASDQREELRRKRREEAMQASAA